MGELFDAGPDLLYLNRCQRLESNSIAVWDVLQSCEREGSLDSAIKPSTIVPNDFAGFFARHARVRRVYFNGAKAEQIFRLRILPNLEVESLQFYRLPSTSPAYASMSRSDKIAAWRLALIG